MFVHTTHLRNPLGVSLNTKACLDADCSEYMGSTSSGSAFFSSLLSFSFTSYNVTVRRQCYVANAVDIGLTGHEDQDIALVEGQMDREDLVHHGRHIVVGRRFLIEGLDRERAARNRKHGHGAEEVAESLRVHGSGRDDEFQIGSSLHDLLHDSEQHIRVQGSLVRFIHDNHGVLLQRGVTDALSQQNSVRHVFDFRRRRRAVLESNRVAHQVANLPAFLVRHSLRHARRRHTTRLRATDQSIVRIALLVQVLRELRRLSGARFSHNHNHLVLANHVQQFLAHRENREELALLLDRLRSRELAASLSAVLHVLRVAVVLSTRHPRLPSPLLHFLVRLHVSGRCAILHLPQSDRLAHLRRVQVPEPVLVANSLALFLRLTPPRGLHIRRDGFQRRAAQTSELGEVVGGVLHDADHFLLPRELDGSRQERRPRVQHDQHDALLVLFVLLHDTLGSISRFQGAGFARRSIGSAGSPTSPGPLAARSAAQTCAGLSALPSAACSAAPSTRTARGLPKTRYRLRLLGRRPASQQEKQQNQPSRRTRRPNCRCRPVAA